MKNPPEAHPKSPQKELKKHRKKHRKAQKKQERRSLSIPANKIIPLFKRLFYYYPH